MKFLVLVTLVQLFYVKVCTIFLLGRGGGGTICIGINSFHLSAEGPSQSLNVLQLQWLQTPTSPFGTSIRNPDDRGNLTVKCKLEAFDQLLMSIWKLLFAEPQKVQNRLSEALLANVQESELESLCGICGLEITRSEGTKAFVPKQTSFNLPTSMPQSNGIYVSREFER